MTNESRHAPALEDILAAFDGALREAPAGSGLLAAWVARYPQYAGELRDWAIAWHTGDLDLLDGDAPPDPAVQAAAAGAIAKLLGQNAAPVPVRPLSSLIEAARAVGLSAADLAKRLRLSSTVDRKSVV